MYFNTSLQQSSDCFVTVCVASCPEMGSDANKRHVGGGYKRHIINKLKKLFIGVMAMLLTLEVCAETNNALIVWTRDGGVVGYELGVRPKVTMTGTDIVLKAGEVVVSYPLSDYVRMAFGRWEFTGMDELEGPKALFRLVDDKLLASGLEPGVAIALYAADGLLVWNGVASEAGTAVIPIAEHAVCVVKVGDINFKVRR